MGRLFSLVSGWWLVSLLRRWAIRIRRRPEGEQTEASGLSTLRRHSRIPGLVFWTVCGVGFLAWVSLGVLTISQVLVHWIPGPVDLWRTIRANDLLALTEGVEAELDSLVWRYTDWAEGVQGGGAYQDELCLSFSFWRSTVVAGRSHGAARSFDPKWVNRGTPALWVLALFLFYGRQSRVLILIGFAATILLHVLLDQQRLETGWARRRSDFSPMLLMDRLLSVGAGATLIVLLAGFMPNVVIRPLAYRVYQTLTPVYDSVDEVTERMFPDLKGGRRGMGRLGSGLPNVSYLKAELSWGVTR